MDIQLLIQQLSASDENERLFAADDLGEAKDEAAVEALVVRLRLETSQAVRETIILALGKIPGDAVLSHARQLLESPDPYIRNEMVALLRDRGDAALPFLLEMQLSSDPDIRKLVLDTIPNNHGTNAFTLLKSGLLDSDLNVLITAVEYVGLLKRFELVARIEELAESSASPMMVLACIETLAAIGSASSVELLEKLVTFQPQFDSRIKLALGSISARSAPGS